MFLTSQSFFYQKDEDEDEAWVVGESKRIPQYVVFVFVAGLAGADTRMHSGPPFTRRSVRHSGVFSSLRDRCTCDHLWEKHMKRKWGEVIGDAAYRESFEPGTENGENQLKKSGLPVHSTMAWYLNLETGEFWFPAQNGHAGFMLSCYDAKLSYDSKTDTFQARYSPDGRRMTEENISWDRLRVPPVDTCSYDLHSSDSLLDLKPGDHIEIQWRKTKEFPYGWWYGVVVHMESCGGTKTHCRCLYTDTVMLTFKQYLSSSRWRKTSINRKDHREVGNEADGFYGGIRKLYKEEEISKWKRLS
ncbi:F-box protein [Hibiscus syriacus]|uniref:F-box protein n=1 Tax=Hibiscus syriacus TaxID=106335 RepID=A0A6A2XQ00_HIBSY|nr:F-box protein [Hibiscus syriacus]